MRTTQFRHQEGFAMAALSEAEIITALPEHSGPTSEAAPRSTAADLDSLLTRVGTGDVAAFDEIYLRMSPKVYGTIIRVLVDRAQSEEVCQDVMVEVWKRSSRYDRTRGGAGPWILAIAHARAVDRVRSSQSARERDSTYALAAVERDRDVVLEAVITSDIRRSVTNAMATLTAAQHECLHLAYFAGKTQTEIAELLRVPLGTIKTRTRRALLRMREAVAAGAVA